MRKLLAALIFGSMVIIPAQFAFAPHALAMAPARSDKCGPPTAPYKCPSTTATVPASGTFTMALARTKVSLKGIASRFTFRTQIFIAQVTMRNVPKHAQAFKVFTSGRIPALKLTTRGKLYQYNVAKASWRQVSAIRGAGIFAAAV